MVKWYSNWQFFTSWSPASQANMAVVQGGNLCRTACQLHEHVAVVNCTGCNKCRTQTLKQSRRIAHLSQAWRLLWLLVTRCLAVKLCESSTAVSTRVHPTVMKVGCRMSQICHTGVNHTARLESEGMWDGRQRLSFSCDIQVPCETATCNILELRTRFLHAKFHR